MPAELIAIIGALFFGIGNIFTRKGLAYSNPFTGTLITIFSSAVLLWGMVFIFVPLNLLFSKYIFIFVIAAIFAPIGGRLFSYIGISRLGVSRSIPINNSSPLFSSILAIIFLGEKMTISILVGTLLIVAGVILLSHEKEKYINWRKRDLIFPCIAALSFGISSNFKKFGLIYLKAPLLGAAVNVAAGFIILLIIISMTRLKQNLEFNKSSIFYYSLTGLCSGGGILMNFLALNKGNVVVVDPLVNSNSLFAIIFSYLFLKGIDVITFRIVIGAVMVFLGINCIILL